MLYGQPVDVFPHYIYVQVSSCLTEELPLITMVLCMLVIFITDSTPTMSLCYVLLMPPTAVVEIIERETGSIPMEVLLIVLLTALVVFAMTSLQGTEVKMLYVSIDVAILQKEDVSAVSCWGTPSMSTFVSNLTDITNYIIVSSPQ